MLRYLKIQVDNDDMLTLGLDGRFLNYIKFPISSHSPHTEYGCLK